MYRRSIPAPRPLKEGDVSASASAPMDCGICGLRGKYKLEDILRHPRWCPGRPPVAAAAAAAVAEWDEPQVAVAVDEPRQRLGGRAPLPAAERQRRAVTEKPHLRRLRELTAEQQRRQTPSAVLELWAASASASPSASSSATDPAAAASPSASSTGPSASGDRDTTASASPAGTTTGSMVQASPGPGGASRSPASSSNPPRAP